MTEDAPLLAQTGRRHRFRAAGAVSMSVAPRAHGEAGGGGAIQAGAALRAGTRTDIQRQWEVQLVWSVDVPAKKITLDPGAIDLTAEPKGERYVRPLARDAKGGVVTYTLTVVPSAGGPPQTATVLVTLYPDLALPSGLGGQEALLMTAEAPRAAGTTNPLDDQRAVWAYVHPRFAAAAPEVALFFHGDNGFVTVNEWGVSRVAGWVKRYGEAARDLASGTDYRLDRVETYGPARAPLMLVPEVGIHHYDAAQAAKILAYFAAVQENAARVKRGELPLGLPPRGRNPWATTDAGSLTAPAQLGKLVADCGARLAKLVHWPSYTGTYLPRAIETTAIRRLLLIGHSGGGTPLAHAAVSDLAGAAPTRVWVLDGSYDWDAARYVEFCKRNQARLAAGDAQLVLIAAAGAGQTASGVNAILAGLRGAGLAALIGEGTLAGKPDPAFAALVGRSPVAVVRVTGVNHGDYPRVFLPHLFEHGR